LVNLFQVNDNIIGSIHRAYSHSRAQQMTAFTAVLYCVTEV